MTFAGATAGSSAGSRQSSSDIRCEWGEEGLRSLSGTTDVFVVVDVLSFCTCVDVASSRGVMIIPCAATDTGAAAALARRYGAHLAGPRSPGAFSLSPPSLFSLQPGERL